jgi:hypothetical protein
MALTAQQLWQAEKIDTKVQKLLRAGKDDNAILAAMVNDMPKFKTLMDAVPQSDMDTLTRKFVGFYRFAKILETLAGDIQAGQLR